MWLVDKSGNLRDTEARFNLERRVRALLEESGSAAVREPVGRPNR